VIPRAEAVWVTETIVWGDRKAPGLLLGWEKRDGAWWGMCVYVQTGAQDSGPYVTQTWVPAAKIEQRGED
jgi:hypothetical protein